jgi:adenylosuccinate lyase
LFSQKVLLALTQAGMSREDAYRLVQRHAMAVWNGDGVFLDHLRADPEVTRHIDADALEALFDLGDYLKHADTIFRRVFTDDDDALNSSPLPSREGWGEAMR